MAFEESAAGEAAIEMLIKADKLVPDFWLRAQSESDWEKRNEQVYRAIQFAMGKKGLKQPEWADPVTPPPDCLEVSDLNKLREVAQEPYYSLRSMHSAYIYCGRKEAKDYRRADQLSRRVWRRLLPHFNPIISGEITDIELEQGSNGYGLPKTARTNHLLRHTVIRGTPLHEFYVNQGEAGLRSVFKGIGEKAMLGVGAMLFMSGEHDELLPAAERLSDLLTK